ncbi:MAG: enoyl-CoA hydratase/isomerase family protein [Burkholderiales bacterium]
MSTAQILAEVNSRGIASVTINRPDKANSYTMGMFNELADHIEKWGADPAVRVIILRGAGKHFSAGAAIGEPSVVPASGKVRDSFEICQLIDTCPAPTIALIQGACVGGGMAIAACCDMTIASRSAFFSIPEARLGMTSGTLSVYFQRAIGANNFRRYAQTGERFSAEDAQRMGFVQTVCESDKLDEGLDRVINELMLSGPNATRAVKATSKLLTDNPLTPTLIDNIQTEFSAAQNSEEAREGKASFREKRRPNWYR